MRFVFFGLSIASSWGNGHATCYRGLLRALHARGHRAVFYERRTPWYDANCDLPAADYCAIRRYTSWPPPDAPPAVREADVVVLGSYAGRRAGHRRLAAGADAGPAGLLRHRHPQDPDPLRPGGRRRLPGGAPAPRFDLVLSFAGGPGAGRACGAGGPGGWRPSTAPSIPTCTAPCQPAERFAGRPGVPGGHRSRPARRGCAELFEAPARAAPAAPLRLRRAPLRRAILAPERAPLRARQPRGSTPPTTPAAPGSST